MPELKRGSLRIKLYRTPSGKYDGWTIAYHLNGTRRREKFAERKKAEDRADQVFTALENGETEAAEMRGADRASLARARELIAKTGQSIETVAAEYAEIKAMMGDRSPKEAIVYFLKHDPAKRKKRSTLEAVNELIELRRAEGCSDDHSKDLTQRLKRFADNFECHIDTITGEQVEEWIRGLPKLGARSRKNYRGAIQNLFTFAQERNYIAKDHDELENVGFKTAPAGRIQVYTPEEMERILNGAANNKSKTVRSITPWIAARAFGGIRYKESLRFDWPSIHFRSRFIVLETHITKTSKRRMIPLKPNLKAWLKPYAGEGKIAPECNVINAFLQLLRELGIPSRHNGLRDSYASYRMAECHDKERVSSECGNSPAKLDQSYRELKTPDGRLITPALARRWFAIHPEKVSNVITLRKAV